jgi:hypothetical protein
LSALLEPFANELTDYFRAGYEAMKAGADRCPHYATSDAAAGWHAGFHYDGPLNAGEIIIATKGTGDRVHLFGGYSLEFGHWIAHIRWNVDDEHRAAVKIERASPMSSLRSRYKREIIRRITVAAGARPPMSERDRQELELRANAPLQSKGRPVADAGHLPLFVSANEPSLF